MKRTIGWLSPALLAVLTGCATAPKPKALDDAERLLVGPNAATLKQERPELLSEAEELLRRAKQAHENGDTDDAVVLAHTSAARYRMAQDLVGAARAQVLAARLSASMSPDEQRQVETDRFLALAERIDALVAKLAESKRDTPPDPLEGEAKAALLEAREKQSEAIGQDVPRLAPTIYAEAASHIASALESLELRSFQVSLRESRRALAGFEKAMAEASKPKEAAPDEAPAEPDQSLAKRAEQAITRARVAQARAAAVPGANATPDFAGGSSLLDAAVSSYEGEVYDEARSLAQDAKRNFEAAAKTKPAPKLENGGTFTAAPAGLEKRTEDMLVELQLRRAELIGQGSDDTCRAAFGEFQAIVELAKERLEKKDVLRAWEFAIRAQERIKRCERSMGVPETPAAPAAPAEDPALRAAALSALQAARVELASARRRDPRSTLLTAGQGLLNSAQKAFEKGGYSETSALAGQAQQILRSVREAVATQPSPAPVTPAPAPKAPEAPEAPKAASAAERRARYAVTRAEDAQLGALERGASTESMAAPDRLLTQATKSLDGKQWDRAARLASRARGQFNRLAQKQPSQTPAPAGPAPDCRLAKAEVDRLSTALTSGQRMDASRRRSARSLYEAARRELDAERCSSALSLAIEARQLALPGAKPAKPAPAPTGPDARPLPADGGDGPVHGAPWEQAYSAIERAGQVRDEVRDGVKGEAATTFNLGIAALDRARAAYRAGRYDEALREAELAERSFERAHSKAPQLADGDNDRVDVGREPSATKPSPKRTPRVVPGGGEPWRKPYFVVYRALELRDQARKKVTDDTKAKLESGEKALAASRKLWDEENFAAAATQARKAQKLFAEVIAAGKTTTSKKPSEPKKPAGEPKKPEEKAPPEATREEADAALREAKVVQKLCGRDACADRDFEALTRAEEAIASAQSAFDEKRYGYTVSLAEKATESLNEILAKPRKSKDPPKIDPKLKSEAEEAIAEAEIQQKLCGSRNCEKIDLEAWLLAQKDFSAAKSARADGDFERATRLAKQADTAFRAIEKTAPTFVIPDDASQVKRSGDQLYLTPAISFGSGSATITPASMASVEALAKVLKENADQLEKVNLIGFTDNSGNAALNKQLSARRAKAVREALIRLGVPANLLTAEGRGQESPIADNGTAEGRKANRRVELRFTLVKGTP